MTKRCTIGCPQGSVLGPTLWNCIMYTLLTGLLPDGVEVFAYADDLAMVVVSNSRTELRTTEQLSLHQLTTWTDQCS